MAVDTREKILDAAARLFAASDTRGASLRAIARAADVNPALIHYHFGSREGLFEAVILRALTPIQARRAELIGALRERPEAPSARDLARLFVEPLLPSPSANREDDPERHTTDLRLLARAFSEEQALTQDLTLKHFGELMYALGDLLGESLPDLPTAIKFRRMRLCVRAALETLSGPESQHAEASEERTPGVRDEIARDLIDFLAGGLQAPVSGAEAGP